MRWLIVVLAVALVVGILLWVTGSVAPQRPTLPEIGPGARNTILLDLAAAPRDGMSGALDGSVR